MDSMWLSINDVRSTEIDYGNDEEVELMKKVMGFSEFDTTKVVTLSSLCVWDCGGGTGHLLMFTKRCCWNVCSVVFRVCHM